MNYMYYDILMMIEMKLTYGSWCFVAVIQKIGPSSGPVEVSFDDVYLIFVIMMVF